MFAMITYSEKEITNKKRLQNKKTPIQILEKISITFFNIPERFPCFFVIKQLKIQLFKQILAFLFLYNKLLTP